MRVLVCLFLFVTLCVYGTHAHVKGVKPRDLPRYSQATFTCDGGVSIPSSSLNDNFCDCVDGSDEPGTSACSNGKFYCMNLRARGKTISSTRVDDGLCDCCDGSDESFTSCPNTCAEAQRAQQERLYAEIASTEAGWEARQRLIEEAKRIDAERQEEIAKLQAKVEKRRNKLELSKVVLTAEEENESAERARLQALENEAGGAAPAAPAAPVEVVVNDGPAAADAAAAASAVETNSAATPAAASNDAKPDGSAAFPYPAEYAYNPDAAKQEKKEEKKENFPYPEEYAFHGDGQKAAAEHDDEEDDGFVQAHYHDDPDAHLDDDEHERDSEHEHDDDEEDEVAHVVINKKKTAADYKSPAAEQARAAHQKYQDKFDSAERKLKELQTASEVDFGPDRVFAAMYKKCFDFPLKQYTYELCAYDSAKQKEGHQSTHLGNWAGIKTEADGSFAFEFTGGTTCWNGPQRSLKAKLKCGAENKILSVDEPSKCVYEMQMTSPAVCDIKHAQVLKINLEASMSDEGVHMEEDEE